MPLSVPAVDCVEFHQRLAARVPVSVPMALIGHLEPIALTIADGSAVTYRIIDDAVTFSMEVGTDATTVVEFDEPAFSAFVTEHLTAAGVHIQQMVRYRRGSFGDFDSWEPVLRLLYSGRPIYDPREFSALDPTIDFEWGVDSTDDIGAFLHRHGFAVVRRVFTTEEAMALDAELDRLAAIATPTDGDSWWVTDDDGVDHVCQLHYTSLSSALIAQLEDDPRVRALVGCTDESFVAHPTNGNGHFAVLKNPGVSGGLTDLPWHVDCGLGGHPILCPSMHLGIQVRPMDERTGEMRFLAGSHLGSARRPTADDTFAVPVVVVTAEPGDVTLHLPDALHAAPPPAGTGPGRRTIYLSYGPASLNELFEHRTGYDQMLFRGDGRVEFDQSDNRASTPREHDTDPD